MPRPINDVGLDLEIQRFVRQEVQSQLAVTVDEKLCNMAARLCELEQIVAAHVQQGQDASVAPPQLHDPVAAVAGLEPQEALPVGVNDSLDNVTFEFEASVWDASVFIGMDSVGAFGSFFSAALLLLNMAMQLLLCFIINDNLTAQDISMPMVHELHSWRTFVAHDFRFADEVTHTSIAARLCRFHGVQMYSGPMDVLEKISAYMPEPGDREANQPYLGHMMPAFKEVGRLMCAAALAIWLFTVATELRSILAFTKAVSSVPRGPQGSVIRSSGGGSYHLVYVWRWRLVFVGITLLGRVFIVGCLLVTGVLFLAHTISLSDLLLNAMALEIVLKLDEMIFTALAPRRLATLMASTKVRSVQRGICLAGLDATPVVLLAGTILMLVLTASFLLQPQAAILQRARDTMCSGNVDFVTIQDEFGTIAAYKTEYKPTVTTDTVRYRVMKELIENSTAAERNHFEGSLSYKAYQDTGVWSMEGLDNMALEQMTARWQPDCSDLDTWVDPMLPHLLQDALHGISNVDLSCASLQPYCNHDTSRGLRARQYCPQTCGCDDPLSDLLLAHPQLGCSTECRRDVRYATALSELPCNDTDTDRGQEPPSLQQEAMARYMEALPTVQQSWPVWMPNLQQLLNETFSSSGCTGLARMFKHETVDPWWWLGNFCYEDNPYLMKPLAILCPIACGCLWQFHTACPPSCLRM